MTAPASAEELAERLGLDALGADTLLTTLSTLGYVEADGERFRNTDVSERLLVRSSPESIATFVGDQGDLHWQVLDLLPDALRTGRPYAMHEERRDDGERWEAYIRGLFEISRPEHEANAALVPAEEPRLLVDVAGGHGGFSMAMCDRHPSACGNDPRPSAERGGRPPDRRGAGLRRAHLVPRGRRVRARPGRRRQPRRGLGLQPRPPPARGAQPRALPDGARGAAAGRLHGDGRLRPAGARRAGLGARGDLEPALLRLEPQSQLHAVRDPRLDGGGGVHRGEAHRNDRSPWRVVVVGR